MSNKLLEIINSYNHALDFQTQEVSEVLDELDNLTYRQIKNVIGALLDKVDSLQKGYKISIGINSAKQKGLKEQLTQMKENDKAETISEMIAVLADEGYEIKNSERPAVRIFNDELPVALQNKIRHENLDYASRLKLVMDILQKAGE